MKKIFITLLLFSFTLLKLINAQTILFEITSNTTWDISDSPVIIPITDNSNEISIFIGAGATLTIEAGVTVIALGSNDKIVVGENGRIVVEGTESDPVIFSPGSIYSSGVWGGIVFNDYSGFENGSFFNHAIFRGGGNTENDGVIDILGRHNGDIKFNSCWFDKNRTCISSQFGDEIFIENCDFRNSEFGAITFNDAEGAIIKDNYFYRNEFALKITMNMPDVLEKNVFNSTNQEVYLPSSISRSVTITVPGILENLEDVMPYSIGSDSNNPTVTITNALVTINPGVTFIGNLFGNKKSYLVVSDEGAIVTLGEKENPVVFTGNSSSQNPGEWGGIILNNQYNSDATEFMNTEFSSAGEGALIIKGGRPTINNCSFSYNTIGLVADSSSEPRINESKFENNEERGILVKDGSDPNISKCTILENGSGIKVMQSSLTLNSTEISENQYTGVYIDDGQRIRIMSCLIEQNSDGIFIESNAFDSQVEIGLSTIRYNENGVTTDLNNNSNVEIIECNLAGNANYAVNNLTTTIVDAKTNWWGDASGPYDNSNDSSDPTNLFNPVGLGAEVSDFVDYSDWLEFYISDVPNILGVKDVPNDQGKNVFVMWSTSFYDELDSELQIVKYSIWQKLPFDSTKAFKEILPTDITLSNNFLADVKNDLWQYIGDVTPLPELDTYIYASPTLADSNAYGIFYSTFMVVAHTIDPSVYFKSEHRSGYSVDNIKPAVPLGFTVAVTPSAAILIWEKNDEDDFAYYALYKNDELITTTIDTSFIDGELTEGSAVYKLSAFDINGNESDYSKVDVVLGINNDAQPTEYSLNQNYPNPFNPTTIIKYEIPEESYIKIEIVNILGESIGLLVNSKKSSGFYEVTWNADSLPSGIYLIVIKAEGLDSKKNFVQVKKALLLK